VPAAHLPSLLPLTAATLWIAACGAHIAAGAISLVQPWLRRRQAKRRDRPPVSVIIPVKRLEPEADAAFASAFNQIYPRFEVLVTAQEESSTVLDLARDVACRSPQIGARFFCGNKQFTRNPKVSNLAPAIRAADHDLILVKDSIIRLQADQLGELVQNLTADVGLVCAVPICVAPVGFAAEIERSIMNGHFAQLLIGLSCVNVNVGFGKVMLFERSNFERAGGISAIGDTFGDDHALALALERLGLRTVYTAREVLQPLGRRSFREVCSRHLRHTVIRRTEEPLAHAFEPLFSGVFAVAAGAAGAPVFGWPAWLTAAGTLVFWLAEETVLVLLKGWGWSWKFPLAGLCREIIVPALWLRSWFSREVRWAGSLFEAPRRAG